MLRNHRSLAEEISDGKIRVSQPRNMRREEEKAVLDGLTHLCDDYGNSFPGTTLFELSKVVPNYLRLDDLGRIIEKLEYDGIIEVDPSTKKGIEESKNNGSHLRDCPLKFRFYPRALRHAPKGGNFNEMEGEENRNNTVDPTYDKKSKGGSTVADLLKIGVAVAATLAVLMIIF